MNNTNNKINSDLNKNETSEIPWAIYTIIFGSMGITLWIVVSAYLQNHK